LYDTNYYKQNKEKFLRWQREYRLKNKDKIKIKRKEYDEKNKKHQLELKRIWRINNMEKVKAQKKKDGAKYYLTNKEKLLPGKRKQGKEYYQKNRDRIRAYHKARSQLPHVKARKAELARIRRRENPQSNRSDSLELQFAKNRVRLRDGNKCQWQGCVMDFRQSRIDVHHIFPKSEHPELELEERFMICYCVSHHAYWHMMRGDHYFKMINPDLEQETEVSGRD
jgi:hypothetical protein